MADDEVDKVLPAMPDGNKESFYIELTDDFLQKNGLGDKVAPGIYGVDPIKAIADDLSAKGESGVHYELYQKLLETQDMRSGNPGAGPYFQLAIDGTYLPVQLIGICQDTKTAGGKAGLTFQLRDIYAWGDAKSTAAGGGAFTSHMNPTATNSGSWEGSEARERLRTTFMDSLSPALQAAIAPVSKFHQLPSGTTADFLQKTEGETVWLPSMREVFGTVFAGYNESEALTTVSGYVPFQYQAYQANAGVTTSTKAVKKHNSSVCSWWLRGALRSNTSIFCQVGNDGKYASKYPATTSVGIVPCFAF